LRCQLNSKSVSSSNFESIVSSVDSFLARFLTLSSRFRCLNLGAVDVDDGPRKSLRRLLRQVMADTPFDDPVRVLAYKFLRVGTCVSMGRPIRVALESDRWHRDDGGLGKATLKIVVLRLAFG
jgi:hypothetical protein